MKGDINVFYGCHNNTYIVSNCGCGCLLYFRPKKNKRRCCTIRKKFYKSLRMRWYPFQFMLLSLLVHLMIYPVNNTVNFTSLIPPAISLAKIS